MPQARSSSRFAVDVSRTLARRTDLSDQPLCQDAPDRRGEKEVLDAQVQKPGDRARGVIGVERRKDQVPREGGLDGDLGRFEIPDLADHDDIRVLADDVPEGRWRN